MGRTVHHWYVLRYWRHAERVALFGDLNIKLPQYLQYLVNYCCHTNAKFILRIYVTGCQRQCSADTVTLRWNKKDARTSPVVSTNRQLPNSLKNWRASLLIGPWDFTEIGTLTGRVKRESSIRIIITMFIVSETTALKLSRTLKWNWKKTVSKHFRNRWRPARFVLAKTKVSKLFQNCCETVLKLFCFSWSYLCG